MEGKMNVHVPIEFEDSAESVVQENTNQRQTKENDELTGILTVSMQP